MAKGNLFLGTARGSVGDVVFSRSNGSQVSRVRNRAPRNPQTSIQLMQRVIMKTAMTGYSMFREICDHAFQGQNGKTANQSAFVKRNVDEMRKELSQLIELNDPDEIMTAQDTNFNAKPMALPVLRPYVMSNGSLQTVGIAVRAGGFLIDQFFNLDWDIDTEGQVAITYQDVVDILGLHKGDQLTFLFAYIDDTTDSAEIIDFTYARVILSPDDGDMTKKFFVKNDGETHLTIANPNSRNNGKIYISLGGTVIGQKDSDEYTAGSARCLVGCSCVLSRLVGGIWQRSTSQLVIRPNNGVGATTNDHETATLGSAIWTYLSDANSSQYLNQAQG